MGGSSGQQQPHTGWTVDVWMYPLGINNADIHMPSSSLTSTTTIWIRRAQCSLLSSTQLWTISVCSWHWSWLAERLDLWKPMTKWLPILNTHHNTCDIQIFLDVGRLSLKLPEQLQPSPLNHLQLVSRAIYVGSLIFQLFQFMHTVTSYYFILLSLMWFSDEVIHLMFTISDWLTV